VKKNLPFSAIFLYFICPHIITQCEKKVEKGRFHLKIKELCTVKCRDRENGIIFILLCILYHRFGVKTQKI